VTFARRGVHRPDADAAEVGVAGPIGPAPASEGELVLNDFSQ
jgi:hypothetical protein